MIEDRPSETALEVAAARAAHLRFDPDPHLLEDVHAESLLDEEGRALIPRYGDDGPWILKENRLFLPLRARFAEDRLAEAHARGCRQLVILGAGLDSFAWRQPEGLADLRIYEVDHPAILIEFLRVVVEIQRPVRIEADVHHLCPPAPW
jgi:methyltransferase (TIGR00027 family)